MTALLLVGVSSCKTGKDSSKTKSTRGDQSIEPDQMTPRVDTRFQEAFFQAQLEKAKENPKKAYALFQECLKIDPKSAAIHYELGRLEMEVFNNPDDALIHAKAAVAADKENPWYHRLLADTYMAQNKFDLAAKSYREVQRINPDDQESLYSQANALLNAGKISDAIAVYDILEKKSGPYEELSMQKHQLYLHTGNKQKAGEELENLAEAFPEEPRYWALVAQYYQSINNVEKAKYATEQMIKYGGDNGQVHFQLSAMYAASNDDKKSFDEMKLAFASTDVNVDQKVSVLLRYFSLIERDVKYREPAFELLEILEKTHTKEAKTYSIYGDFLYHSEKPEEALIKYRKAAELNPSVQVVWEQILIIEGELQDFDKMLVDSQSALELFPTLPQFYLFNGIAHQQKNNYTKAIAAYRVGKDLVIEDDELMMRFYSYLGEAYHKQGDNPKSDEAFDKALKIDGKNIFVLNNYAYYLAVRNEKLEKAAQMAKKANELAPNQSSFEDTYAWVLFQQGKYSEALEWIRKSISHTKPSGELLEHYGDILYKNGDTAGAIEQWKNAKASGSTGKLIDQKIQQEKYIE